MSKQTLSECCAREVIKGHKHDPHPLGRGEYNGRGIIYTIDVCSGCRKECTYELAKVCDCCGEQEEHLITTRLGEWCQECTQGNAEELMVREVRTDEPIHV